MTETADNFRSVRCEVESRFDGNPFPFSAPRTRFSCAIHTRCINHAPRDVLRKPQRDRGALPYVTYVAANRHESLMTMIMMMRLEGLDRASQRGMYKFKSIVEENTRTLKPQDRLRKEECVNVITCYCFSLLSNVRTSCSSGVTAFTVLLAMLHNREFS